MNSEEPMISEIAKEAVIFYVFNTEEYGKPYCCGLEISEKRVQLYKGNLPVDLEESEHHRILQQCGRQLSDLIDVQSFSMY